MPQYEYSKWKKWSRAALLNMWSGYLFDVCIRKIHLCAFLIYGAGRQAGRQGGKQQTRATNHGYNLNDRLQPHMQTVDCHLHVRPSFFPPTLEITVESDVMYCTLYVVMHIEKDQ